jgi:hypothetical protein
MRVPDHPGFIVGSTGGTDHAHVEQTPARRPRDAGLVIWSRTRPDMVTDHEFVELGWIAGLVPAGAITSARPAPAAQR